MKTFKEILLILLFLAIFIFGILLLNSIFTRNTEHLSKKIDSLYIEINRTKDSLLKINERLFTIKEQTLKNTRQTEENIKKIIQTQKKLKHEQQNTYQNIINSSDSVDWKWFNNTFTK